MFFHKQDELFNYHFRDQLCMRLRNKAKRGAFRCILLIFISILCSFELNAKEGEKKRVQKLDLSSFDKGREEFRAHHYTVFVSQNISFQGPSISKHSLPVNPSYSETVWLSESAIRCELLPFASGKAVTMECKTPDNYKLQVTADCSLNNSEQNAVSFFFGIEGKLGGHRNFKMWCGS